MAGTLLASPMIFSQLWRFVAPGLYHHEKRIALPFTLLSALFFAAGAAFGYLVVFPPAFEFLMGYTTDYLSPMPSVSEYFSLSLRLLIAFGIVFELPVFMVLLARIGIVNVLFLRSFRRYAVLLSFVFAAMLTPPDVVSQLLMAGPLLVLYELSIMAVRLFGGKGHAGDGKEEGAVQKG